MFGRAPGQFVRAPGRGLQLDALVALAFGDFLAPHEQPGPGALRAGIAAPDPPGEHGDGEQAEGTDDQQGREQDEVLGPEGRAEDMEAAFSQVPEHRLAAAPVQPYRAEEQQEQKARATQAQVTKQPAEAAGMDQLVGGLGLHPWTQGLEGFNTLDGDSLAHGLSLVSLHQAWALCRANCLHNRLRYLNKKRIRWPRARTCDSVSYPCAVPCHRALWRRA